MESVSDLLKAAESVEFAIFKEMEQIRGAYMLLTNAKSLSQAEGGLKLLELSVKLLEQQVRAVLYRWGVPDVLILNLNDKALTLWTADSLSALWVNANQFYLRFVHSTTAENKTKELTAFYFLVKDLVECSQAVKAENYYGANQE